MGGYSQFLEGFLGGGTPSITPKQQNMCEHCLKLSAHGIDFSYAGGNGWGIQPLGGGWGNGIYSVDGDQFPPLG